MHCRRQSCARQSLPMLRAAAVAPPDRDGARATPDYIVPDALSPPDPKQAELVEDARRGLAMVPGGRSRAGRSGISGGV